MWIYYGHRLKPIDGPDGELIYRLSRPPIEHIQDAVVASTDDDAPVVGETNLPGTGVGFCDFDFERLDTVVVVEPIKRYALSRIVNAEQPFAGVHVRVPAAAISVLIHVEEEEEKTYIIPPICLVARTAPVVPRRVMLLTN